MLYRLLIVEDDNNIRKGLLKIIGKMELPLESIYEAENGESALYVIGQHQPDIIITDIKMPGMSGLDFIDHVKKSGSNARFIILSGYGEFSFAQRAISYNVSEYLLKPVKKEKLYNALIQQIKKLKEEEEETERKLRNERKLKEYYTVIIKEMLEGYQSLNDIELILSSAGITLRKTGFSIYSLYCKARIDVVDDFLDQNSESLNICFKYVNRHSHIVCLSNTDMAEHAALRTLLNKKIPPLALANKITIYCGLSEWTNMIAKLPELIKEAEKALDFRLLSNSSQVFQYAEIKKQTKLKPALNAYYEEIANAVDREDTSGLNTGIDRLFNFLQSLSPLTPSLLKNSIAYYFLYYLPSEKQDLSVNSINTIEDIYQQSDTLLDFRMNIKKMLNTICINEKEDAMNLFGIKISTAIKYIENNYAKNISLEDVAGHINANASYFSKTFKKDTGMYFSDYLQKIRIEKSKSLLMQPRYKIYEVAENVGFMDEKYFFKVFKKVTGVTPNQYRNGFTR